MVKQKEIWKYITNYEGFYKVSNLGNIKSCNRVENLEWVDNSENINHAYNNNLISRPMSKKIKNTVTGEIFNTIGEACESTNFSRSHVSMMLSGDRKNKTNLVYCLGKI